MNRTTALIAAGALVAAPLATAPRRRRRRPPTRPSAASAARGSYEFQVDREDREDGGASRSAPTSTASRPARAGRRRQARGQARQQGHPHGRPRGRARRRRAAANTSGTDTFRFKAVPAGGGSKCARHHHGRLTGAPSRADRAPRPRAAAAVRRTLPATDRHRTRWRSCRRWRGPGRWSRRRWCRGARRRRPRGSRARRRRRSAPARPP